MIVLIMGYKNTMRKMITAGANKANYHFLILLHLLCPPFPLYKIWWQRSVPPCHHIVHLSYLTSITFLVLIVQQPLSLLDKSCRINLACCKVSDSAEVLA